VILFVLLHVLGDVPFGDDACHVLIEGSAIIGPVDFRTALMSMFAAYYLFNIAYPATVSSTLEFVQRLVEFECDRCNE
jgi:hypothetical protein